MKFFTSSHSKFTLLQGFTLIELLVSLAIITVITSVVVFNQNNFADQVALSNTGSEIALQIREAQTYGVSVREFSPGTSEFNLAYGISFAIASGGASNNSYIYFADRNLPGNPQDGYYTSSNPAVCQPGATSECLGRLYISRGNIITNLCAILANGNCVAVDRTDITFLRPYPNARLAFFHNGGIPFSPSPLQGARITLSSPSGKTTNIDVYTTGQVSVQ
jgi:prepilin-type N-terminal cleavage/methylation domain-containing protein